MGDVQSTQQEDRSQRNLLPYGEAETPYGDHREYQNHDVKEHIRNSRTKEGSVIIDAFTVRVRSYPGGLDRYTLEDVGEDDCDAPACDEGEDDVAGILEGFADTKEAVVEEEDGDFDEGYADAVEYFVGDGCLCGMSDRVRNCKGSGLLD